MNVVEFGTICIHNYKSIGDEVRFDYRDYGGMTYVKGENLDMPDLANGTGKSTIFVDALLMVLFGIQSNKFKNNNIFHRQAKHDIGWIKLQMFVNGQEWNVHCVFTRSKKGDVSLSRALYEGHEICDDNSRTKSSMAQTLKFIADDVLKCDSDTFKNAVVLSTSNIQNFFTLPRPAKDAYLDSVFTLAAFGIVYKEVKKQLNSLKKELSSQREIFESLKENHEQILQKSKEFISEKEVELAELDKKIKMSELEIKKLKESIVNIDDLEAAIQMYRANIADFEAEIKNLEAERAEFSINEANVSALVDQYNDELHAEVDTEVARIDEDILTIQKKIDQVNDVITSLKFKIENIGSSKEELEENRKTLSEKSNKISDARRKVQAEISAMIQIKTQFEETFDLLCAECQKKTHEHFAFDQNKYDAFEEKQKQLLTLTEANCEEISKVDEALKKLNSEESAHNEKIKKAEEATATAFNEISVLQHDQTFIKGGIADKISAKERALYEEARKEYEAATKENVDKCSELAKLIDAQKDAIRESESSISETKSCLKRIEDGTKVLKDLLADKEKANAKENPFDSLVADGEKKIATAKDTIKAILKDQRKFDLLANIYSEDGVKKHIVSNIVASLNVIIKKYLAEMGADYVVVFDDKFQYNFYTPSGETDYWTFSSGERRRLDMAVMLALRDILFTNGLVTNLLVVDEVLDSGIDQYALFAIINILKNKTQDRNLGCIIISHRSELFTDMGEDTFDRIQYVIKENGQSRLENASIAFMNSDLEHSHTRGSTRVSDKSSNT